MANTKEKFTKDGKRYFKISVSRGYGKTPFTKSWYPLETWCEKTVQRELAKAAAQFEQDCKNGNVENRAMKKEKARQEELERAKLKTFKDYALSVFMPMKEQSITENTRSSYQSYLDLHINPFIGKYQLAEITPAMINKLLLDFQKTHSHASTVKLYNIINGVFDMAFMDYSIQMNPMQRVKRPKQSKDEQQTPECEKALTIEQLKTVLECVKKEPLQWQAYITLSADLGCRRGELCGLQWNDIDFINQKVTLNRTLNYTQNKGAYIGLPKNGKIRTIDIGFESLNLLNKLHQHQLENSIVTPWVFTQYESAEPMHPQSPTRYFEKFSRKYDIPNFHPHILRHTSASVAITNGADVASVSARLGHSDTAVTLRMYTHATDESIRKAGDVVRNLLKESG